MFMQQLKDSQNLVECVCRKLKTIKIMPNVYVVGKTLSKPCEMLVSQVKDGQNHTKCVGSK